MGIKETFVTRRVDVRRGIGIPVMIPMCFRPPQDSPLYSQTSEDGKEELDNTRRLERLMSKITVITDAESKSAHEKTAQTNGHTTPGDTGDQDRKTDNMQKSVGDKNINAKFRIGESAD